MSFLRNECPLQDSNSGKDVPRRNRRDRVRVKVITRVRIRIRIRIRVIGLGLGENYKCLIHGSNSVTVVCD